MSKNVIPDEINETTLDLLRALRDLRKAQADFRDAMSRMASAERRVAAQANTDLQNAMSLGSWWQGQVTALGSALAGLCLSQMGEPR